MSNPVQVNMYGIRYFIDGDLSDPLVKKLMVQARNDLQQMKGRNINNIPHIWLNKPNAYKIVSQFGIDSAYINVPPIKKRRKIPFEIELIEQKDDIRIEYLPTFEVYDVNDNQIGYVVCESGIWEPPYLLILTPNVISPLESREGVEVAHSEGITVDPFYFPVWKYWYGDEVGKPEDKPFDGILKDKLVTIIDQGNVEIEYWDVASTFEELILPDPYQWEGYTEEFSKSWTSDDYLVMTHCIELAHGWPNTCFAHIKDVVTSDSYVYQSSYLKVSNASLIEEPYNLDNLTGWPYIIEDYSLDYVAKFAPNIGVRVNDSPDLEDGWLENEVYLTETWFPAQAPYDLSQITGATTDYIEYTGDAYKVQETWEQPNYSDWSNAYDTEKYAAFCIFQSFPYSQRVVKTWTIKNEYESCGPTGTEDVWTYTTVSTEENLKDYEIFLLVDGEKLTYKKVEGTEEYYFGTDDKFWKANVRYYQLSEELVYVLVSAETNHLDAEDQEWIYMIFRSNKEGSERFLFNVEFPEIQPTVYLNKDHVIPGITTPDGGLVIAKGQFRLFKRITKEVYPKEITSIKYEIEDQGV